MTRIDPKQKSSFLLFESLIFFVATFLFFTPFALADNFTGKVVGVSDGDTIKVFHLGKAEKIRLTDIDCPETKQAYGTKAKRFVSDLVYGKKVTVMSKGKDRFGRTLGEVILSDGRSLNRELLKAGLAWHYKRYSKDEELAKLEDEARAGKVGLWADPKAVPPWVFRKKSK